MFEDDLWWQAQWTVQVRQFIGPYILRAATFEEDATQATDLIVVRADGLRVACRIRKPDSGYAEKYGHEITFTSRRESGAPCEWDKMILGNWGDWFFYAHATTLTPREGGRLCPAVLLDLHATRQYFRDTPVAERGPNKNPIGMRCWFFAYDIDEVSRRCGPDAIIARRH